jgi:diadenosine tetraphosphatase ApaH/serine/threonine PP2A family protein phosphatase
VGQPRDGDPRAAFALLDTERLTLTGCRVDYDIAATQQAMRALNLPERLAARLSTGR